VVLIADIGLRPVRVGDLDRVEAVDNVLELWASLAMFEGKGRASVAFAMLER
jgi:8-hydroxy-5-deazaflavin:NADPH oxidoreductase